VPTALVEHLFDRARRHVKEAGDVDGDQRVEVVEDVVREGLTATAS
jgi:2-iminoacetate synthase ThiH